MAAPFLPPELVDAISFHQDRYTLAAMASVCRAWAGPAGRRLWREVRIRPAKVPEMTLLLEGRAGNGLAHCVKKLDLVHITGSPTEKMTISRKILLTLLDILPNLQELCLEALPFRSEAQPEPGRHALKLVHIDFTKSRRRRLPTDLAAFLNIFTDIGTLQIIGYDFTESVLPSLTTVRRALDSFRDRCVVRTRVRELRSTETTASGGVVILELFRRGLCPRQLEVIHASTPVLQDFIVLCDLLQEAGDSVLDLTLGIGQGIWDSTQMQMWQESETKISACTSLRTLTIQVNATRNPDSLDIWSCQWFRAVSFLRRLPPLQITSIRLILGGNTDYFMGQFEATAGRLMLAGILDKMIKLKTVTLVMAFTFDAEYTLVPDVRDAFWDALPEIAGRGMLRVEDELDMRVLDNEHTN